MCQLPRKNRGETMTQTDTQNSGGHLWKNPLDDIKWGEIGTPDGIDFVYFKMWEFSLIAGERRTFQAESLPKYWNVSMFPTASTRVRVFIGPDHSGQGFPLGSGGKLKVPASLDQFLTIWNVGAVTVDGVAVATRNHNVMIDLGD